jgi:hypothetical protein
MKYCVEIISFEGKEVECPQRLKNLGARVLFKLSAINFDVVFRKVEYSIKNIKNDK